jgi:hypothetical protein
VALLSTNTEFKTAKEHAVSEFGSPTDSLQIGQIRYLAAYMIA